MRKWGNELQSSRIAMVNMAVYEGKVMTDTDLLNLMEHYKWEVSLSVTKSTWFVAGSFSTKRSMAKGASLREALLDALDMQRKWSIG